jgi:hypothetical protein
MVSRDGTAKITAEATAISFAEQKIELLLADVEK